MARVPVLGVEARPVGRYHRRITLQGAILEHSTRRSARRARRGPTVPGAQPGCQSSASRRTQPPALGAGGVPLDAQLTGTAASREHGEVLSGLSPGRMSSASIRGAPSHGARPLDAQLASLGPDPRAPGAQPGCQCSASTRTQRPTLGAGGVPVDLSSPVASHEHGQELNKSPGLKPGLMSPASRRAQSWGASPGCSAGLARARPEGARDTARVPVLGVEAHPVAGTHRRRHAARRSARRARARESRWNPPDAQLASRLA